MLSTSFMQPSSQLTTLIDFKPVDTSEAKPRDAIGGKSEIDVRVYCLNCMPNHAQRDVEELRMFEYSYSYHNYLLNVARQKVSQRFVQGSTGFPASMPTAAQSLPPIVSNTYVVPPPNSQPSQPGFQSFPAFNFGSTSATAQPPATSSSIAQPFSFNTVNTPATSAPAFNLAPFASKPPDGPFQQQPQQPQQPQSQFGFNPITTSATSFNPFNQPVSSAPAPMTGLSSAWNTSAQQNPQQPPPPSSAPQTAVYPSSHLGPTPPPYVPYPYYHTPRYYPYADPYSYMRPPVPPPFDPYSFMYRDPSYADTSKEATNIQKLLLQRQATQALWHRYGIDPDIPVSDTFGVDKDKKRVRPNTFDPSNRSTSDDPVIHVVPTLAGFKDGKQQIILNIEETAENRSYIPKIFNPNSEISFTVTSRDSSANKSYLANITQDSVDHAIVDNVSHVSPPMGRVSKDLPKPILNKKLVSRRKSILEMNLSDYHVAPKVDGISRDDSITGRRVTFQEEPTSFQEVLKENKSPSRSQNMGLASLFSSQNLTETNETASSIIPAFIPQPLVPSPTSQTSPALGGTLTSFNDSLAAGYSQHTANDPHTSVSLFKWTPSWFLSKFITGLGYNDNASTAKDSPSITEVVDPPSCKVVLTRTDYYTRPSIFELDRLCVDKRCIVSNFTVGRYNVGKVRFHGDTDVYGLDLDNIVFINNFEIEVYRDEDESVVKPPVGVGLNKPATLTLFNVYPQDTDGNSIRDFDNDTLKDFETYLRSKAASLNAEFIEYLPDVGSFSFAVQHFTKYGIALTDIANLSAHSQLSNVDSTLLSHYIQQTGEANKENEFDPDKSFQLRVCPKDTDLLKFYLTHANMFIEPGHLIEHATCFGYSSNFCSPFSLLRTSHDVKTDAASNLFPPEIHACNQSVVVSRISSTDPKVDNFQKIFTCFHPFLEFSPSDGDTLPVCKVTDAISFLSAHVSNSSNSIFSLIKCLSTDSRTFTLGDQDSDDIARVKHFLTWVSDTCGDTARKEASSLCRKGDHFTAVLHLISANLFEEAIQILNDTKNYRLATILSSFCTQSDECARQLVHWVSDGLYRFMDKSYVKLWMLMSNIYILEDAESTIHVCESFDWIRCLSLFINFSKQSPTRMRDAIELYKFHYKEYPSLVAPPLSPATPPVLDIKFHIISHFVLNHVNAVEMFETTSYTTNPLDYSVSWHVYQILNLIKPIPFQHESTIAHSYACLLESQKCWHLSIFVLLFLRKSPQRDSLISQLIQKHVHETANHANFLKRIHIPAKFLHLSKAQFANYRSIPDKFVKHLLRAHAYTDAYLHANRYIVPQLFMRQLYSDCTKLLDSFNAHVLNHPHYVCNGKVYLDACHLETNDCSTDPRDTCLSILNRISSFEVIDISQKWCRSYIAMLCLNRLAQTSTIDKSVDLDHLFSFAIQPEHAQELLLNTLSFS